MKIRYENHNGEVLKLSEGNYILDPSGIFDYEWQYQSTNLGGHGGRISKFYRDLVEKDITLYVRGDTRRAFDGNLRDFFDVVEADVLETAPGRLVLDTGEYMICYLVASKKTFCSGVFTMISGARIVTEKPFWCRDVAYRYDPNRIDTEDQSGYVDPYLDYKFDYKYDYKRGTNIQTIHNDFIEGTQGNDFEMTIYGFVDQPLIMIGNNSYRVHTTIYPTERMVINSRNRTVKRYKPDGEIVDLFNFRDKTHSVFSKIAPGVGVVSSNAAFDLTVYQERSEPLWNL
jgi:hypothetical protein